MNKVSHNIIQMLCNQYLTSKDMLQLRLTNKRFNRIVNKILPFFNKIKDYINNKTNIYDAIYYLAYEGCY
jgi:hypothetical protein